MRKSNIGLDFTANRPRDTIPMVTNFVIYVSFNQAGGTEFGLMRFLQKYNIWCQIGRGHGRVTISTLRKPP